MDKNEMICFLMELQLYNTLDAYYIISQMHAFDFELGGCGFSLHRSVKR